MRYQMNQPLENPFYYLDNFQRLLDWIAARYDDLLLAEESAFIAQFPSLPQASRALLVRMIMRKGTLFRANKLVYPEIGCALTAARTLEACGWIERDPALNIEALFGLLQKTEVAQVFELTAHQRAATKAQQLSALRPDFAQARPFSAWFRQSGDEVLHVLAKPLCERLRLIFFGNFHQDWSEFVLADLGLTKYEHVAFGPTSRGFRNRRDIDTFLALYRCQEMLHAAVAPADVQREIPPCIDDNAWLAGRRAKLLYRIGQRHEQEQHWDAALAVYQVCDYPGARARAIRVLEKNQQWDAAYALLLRAESAPESEAERQHLLRIGPRLRRKLGHPKQLADAITRVARLDLALAPSAQLRVEQLVCAHLQRDDAPVFYVENALINALFGLLCWRAIFSTIPGAFFHPFQRAPADLHSAHFYQRRAAQFAQCFAELDGDAYRATIIGTYADKRGTQSPFLAWDLLSAELIEMALACIPARHLKYWFERMLQDLKTNCSGFPDLIQFWPAEQRYQMIEVKGPGDRLQDSQQRWIAYCAAHQMPIAVCYVQWANAAA